MIEKKEIMFWDDAGFWLHKIEKDSIDKIKEDLYNLSKAYIEEINRPHLTSAYETLKDIHLQTAFLMEILNIAFRLDRLENK